MLSLTTRLSPTIGFVYGMQHFTELGLVKLSKGVDARRSEAVHKIRHGALRKETPSPVSAQMAAMPTTDIDEAWVDNTHSCKHATYTTL